MAEEYNDSDDSFTLDVKVTFALTEDPQLEERMYRVSRGDDHAGFFRRILDNYEFKRR